MQNFSYISVEVISSFRVERLQCQDYLHHHTFESPFSAISVNNELLQKLTNGKANLNKPIVIPRSFETSVPLDYHSPPEEVADWLRGKGFSEPWVLTDFCRPDLPHLVHIRAELPVHLFVKNTNMFSLSEVWLWTHLCCVTPLLPGRWPVWVCWQAHSSSLWTKRSYELWFQMRALECTVSWLCRKHC